MKVLSSNLIVNNRSNLPVYSQRQEVYQNRYNSPSFGASPVNIAKEVAQNQTLLDLWAKIVAKLNKEAALAFISSITAGTLAVNAANDTQTEENSLFSKILESLTHASDDMMELMRLKEENRQLKDENRKLNEQLNTETKDDNIVVTEEPPIENAPVETSPKQEAEITEEHPATEEDAKPAEKKQRGSRLYKVTFPPIGHKPSKLQSNLKNIVESLKLPKADGKKLTEICAIALKKDYLTKNGKNIDNNQLIELLIKVLSSNEDPSERIDKIHKLTEIWAIALKKDYLTKLIKFLSSYEDPSEIIDKIHKRLTGTADLSAETLEIETGTIAGNEGKPSTKSDDGINPASKEGDRVTEVEQTPVIVHTNSTHHVESISVGTIDADIVLKDNFCTRYETTPDDPFVSFPYFSICKPNIDLFAVPDTYKYTSRFNDNRSITKYQRESAGDCATILLELQKFYKPGKENSERRENVRIWANNILYPPENSSAQISTEDMSGVAIYVHTDRKIAADVEAIDILDEIRSKNDESYKHINEMLVEDTTYNGRLIMREKDSPFILELVDVINEEERFKNFGLHGALRFIERIVDFDSDVPIKDQCSSALDHLFNLMKRAFKAGVQVNTYMYPTNNTDKYDNIIVKLTPNVVISKDLYTPEERRLFRDEDIIISLCEYQPGKKYDKDAKIPIIKTMMINNSW